MSSVLGLSPLAVTRRNRHSLAPQREEGQLTAFRPVTARRVREMASLTSRRKNVCVQSVYGLDADGKLSAAGKAHIQRAAEVSRFSDGDPLIQRLQLHSYLRTLATLSLPHSLCVFSTLCSGVGGVNGGIVPDRQQAKWHHSPGESALCTIYVPNFILFCPIESSASMDNQDKTPTILTCESGGCCQRNRSACVLVSPDGRVLSETYQMGQGG
eukprot:9482771-Pyramimonas_sp.AAC.1